uniref:Neur_chan_LBD domain-containing protein n=1 Tax=Steinernema glaseri TaxID=37863 RepID=A0A1I7ZJN8_9BILA
MGGLSPFLSRDYPDCFRTSLDLSLPNMDWIELRLELSAFMKELGRSRFRLQKIFSYDLRSIRSVMIHGIITLNTVFPISTPKDTGFKTQQ